MATRSTSLNIDITATDDASPKIDKLEKKIDGLESDEARIIVTAQTDKLEKQLDSAKQKLDGLDGDHATVQARLIGDLEAELEQAQTLFNQLDGKTGTVRLNAIDKASKDIDQVAAKMRHLDGETARVRTTAAGIAGGVAGGLGLAAIPGLLLAGAEEATNLAIEVDALAKLTGSTVEETSRLTGQFATVGAEASDLREIILNVHSVLSENPELAAQLGVQIETNTSLLDTFVQAVDGVSTAYDNAGERALVASQLFGEEGVASVSKVTAALETDLATALEQFKGPVITQESVDNARVINAELLETKQHIQEISLALLPIINGLLGGTVSYFKGVADAGAWTQRQFNKLPNIPGYGEVNYSGGPAPAGQRGQGVFPSQVTVINPPGTPAATVDAARVYQRRNGQS